MYTALLLIVDEQIDTILVPEPFMYAMNIIYSYYIMSISYNIQLHYEHSFGDHATYSTCL